MAMTKALDDGLSEKDAMKLTFMGSSVPANSKDKGR